MKATKDQSASKKGDDRIALSAAAKAIKVGDFVFCSGATGRDPVTREIVRGGFDAQTRQAFRNVRTILKIVGATTNDVVKTTYYLRNASDFERFKEIRAEFTDSPGAATGVFGVELASPEALVEIDVIATTSRNRRNRKVIKF